MELGSDDTMVSGACSQNLGLVKEFIVCCSAVFPEGRAWWGGGMLRHSA